ncbi:MAG: glycosyltransferase family 87 protein [Myxococcota bacterium]
MIDRERLTNYPRMFAALYVLLGGWWILGGEGMLDRSGKNVGVDFVTFWAGSEAALAGRAASVWDAFAMQAAQQAAIGAPIGPYAFHYPPTFLLLCLPLSWAPYLVSFAIWCAAGTALYLAWARAAAPDPVTPGLALAFPGFFQNVLQGQNGLFTTALLGGALWQLDARPALAGVLLGVLSFKPHLAAAAFLAIAAGRRWRALATAVATAGVLAVASYGVLGQDAWLAFAKNGAFAVRVLETEGVLPWNRMPTVQVAAMLLGAPVAAARVLQAVAALAAAGAMVALWARGASFTARAASLVGALFLVTPFAFDYDQALLAIPAAAIGWEVLQGRGRRGEGWLAVAAWIAPLAVPAIAGATRVQLGPALAAWLVVAAWRRG